MYVVVMKCYKYLLCFFFLIFQAIGLIRREKSIIVATMDDCLVSYTSKGKKIWSLKLPHNIICLESMDILSRGVQLAAVALANRYVFVQYINFNYIFLNTCELHSKNRRCWDFLGAIRDPIIYYFDSKSLSRYKKNFLF